MPQGEQLNALEWLGIVGSIASILSIILNIFQGIVNKHLRRDLGAVLSSSERVLQTISNEAEQGLSSHAAAHEGILKSILAGAQRTRETLTRFRLRHSRGRV